MFFSKENCDLALASVISLLSNHLSHIQQVDLEEEAQRTACDLVGSPADGIAQFIPHSQTSSLVLRLKGNEREKTEEIVCLYNHLCICQHWNAHLPRGATHYMEVVWAVVRDAIIILRFPPEFISSPLSAPTSIGHSCQRTFGIIDAELNNLLPRGNEIGQLPSPHRSERKIWVKSRMQSGAYTPQSVVWNYEVTVVHTHTRTHSSVPIGSINRMLEIVWHYMLSSQQSAYSLEPFHMLQPQPISCDAGMMSARGSLHHHSQPQLAQKVAPPHVGSKL